MIVINARFLTQPITGVQRYAIELSKVLIKEYNGELRFVTHPGIIHHDLAKHLNALVIGTNKSHIWEQTYLYKYLLKNNKPLLLSFGYTGPLLYKNQIITVHDMAFKFYKNTFSKSFAFLYNLFVPIISKRCLHVLTVSNSSKIEICKELNLPENKVSVIYNGITPIFKKDFEKKYEKMDKKKPYILTVSSHHPRKNYQRLIEAFKKLNDNSVELYVIGNFIGHFESNENFQESRNIKFFTNISDEELVSYYQNAKLFVFPSIYEGFGIPVIEAMSNNLPCVISDIPVFREIGDNQVVYVNPFDVCSIVNGLKKGLAISQKKFVYPKTEMFSWQKSAIKINTLLKKFSKK